MCKQKTIAKAIEFSGVGLHTGQSSTMLIEPADENYGVKFGFDTNSNNTFSYGLEFELSWLFLFALQLLPL